MDNSSRKIENISTNQVDNVDSEEISYFLSRIINKYSGNAEQKHLNQLYDIGVLCVNKRFDYQRMIRLLTKVIDERSKDPIKKIREEKRSALIAAFKKGSDDASSEEYRMAYDKSNRYQYNDEKLKIRAHIDSIIDKFSDF
jgi:DNA-binding transcriptional ArsR family regulator